MTAPAEAKVLIDTGGLVVTDDGRRVNIFDRRTGGLATTAFVLGIVVLVVGGFGLVAMVTNTPSVELGAIFVAVGVAIAVVLYRVVLTILRRRSQPLHNCRSVAVIDRKLGLFSYGGGAIVPLDQVQFARRMQIGSSSSKLVALTPGGTKVLKRGNPFDGGIKNADEVLTAVIRGG
jgi:hypothetical protein